MIKYIFVCDGDKQSVEANTPKEARFFLGKRLGSAAGYKLQSVDGVPVKEENQIFNVDGTSCSALSKSVGFPRTMQGVVSATKDADMKAAGYQTADEILNQQ